MIEPAFLHGNVVVRITFRATDTCIREFHVSEDVAKELMRDWFSHDRRAESNPYFLPHGGGVAAFDLADVLLIQYHTASLNAARMVLDDLSKSVS